MLPTQSDTFGINPAGGINPASETAFDMLRHDIVAGVLKPDTKLKMRELKARYGMGGSPLREALAQLTARGLVSQEPQRGFRVPALSPQHLIDITRSRQLMEPEALKLAIAHGDTEWEDEIIASFRLLEVEAQRRARNGAREHFETRHHRFHRALIAACPLAALKSFCDGLYVQSTRYRFLLSGYRLGAEPVVAEHRILMDAVLSRSRSKASKALAQHIGLTADLLLGHMAKASDRPRKSNVTSKKRSTGRTT